MHGILVPLPLSPWLSGPRVTCTALAPPFLCTCRCSSPETSFMLRDFHPVQLPVCDCCCFLPLSCLLQRLQTNISHVLAQQSVPHYRHRACLACGPLSVIDCIHRGDGTSLEMANDGAFNCFRHPGSTSGDNRVQG